MAPAQLSHSKSKRYINHEVPEKEHFLSNNALHVRKEDHAFSKRKYGSSEVTTP